MDAADRANRLAEQEREVAAGWKRPAPDLHFTGHCHWCDEAVAEPQRFCDRDCADDFEREWLRK